MSQSQPILELQSVEKYFEPNVSVFSTVKNRLMGTSDPHIRAVDGINLELHDNEVHGVIGESGCGKTTLLRTIIGMYDTSAGDIRFHGDRISEFDTREWKEYRKNVQFIFQDPFNSLNPKFKVRNILEEPLKIHDIEYEMDRVHEALETVRLTPTDKYVNRYPAQLSGGEKQRVSIARALITDPDVILADEPTSMLDVSTQADILNLLRELTDELGVSMIYISHDLSTVSYTCDYVNVMYLGRIVESGPTMELISSPKHPYSQALVQAIPLPDPAASRARTALSGEPGDPIGPQDGCRFKDRCPERMDICDHTPEFIEIEGEEDHAVACHLYYDHFESMAGQSASTVTSDSVDSI